MSNGGQIVGQLFEAINGFLFVVCLGLAIFFASYLMRRLRGGAKWSEVKLGFALFTFVVGDGIIRAPVWYYRHQLDQGLTITDWTIDKYSAVICLGAIVAAVGGLCALRVAAPEKMRPWPWVLTLLVAILFVFFSLDP